MAMPNVDGYEVLAEIKASDGLRHIPVIMIGRVNRKWSAPLTVDRSQVRN